MKRNLLNGGKKLKSEDEFATTSVRMRVGQIAKIDRLAKSVGVSRNRLFGMLVDNAEVAEVKRIEPVARISPVEKKNSRSAASHGQSAASHGQSATAIAA